MHYRQALESREQLAAQTAGNALDSQAAKGHKSKAFRIFLLIVAVIIGFFVAKGIVEAPRDLGPDFVYLGRYDCQLTCLFPISDSMPYTYYYFGTNMSVDSLRQLITRLGFAYDESQSGDSFNGYTVLTFKPNHYSSKGLYITYYDASDPAFHESDSNVNFIRTTKKHVVEMHDYDYSALRNALQASGK